MADRLSVDQRTRLLDDLAIAVVQDANQDETILTFDLPGHTWSPAEGQAPYPVEGQLRDANGAKVTIVLYSDGAGRLCQLEYIRWGDDPPAPLNWETLELY
jgi:hypothetical protein